MMKATMTKSRYRNMKQQLNKILKPHVELCSQLECDGTTRVLSYVLDQHNIDHKVMVGQLVAEDDGISLHYWIEVGEYIVDYKAQMWLDEQAPHGVFTQAEVLPYGYYGSKVPMPTSSLIYRILT